MDKDFEDMLDRVQTAPGVSDIIVIKNEEDSDLTSLVRSTSDDKETALRYGNVTKTIFDRASGVVRNLDPTNDLFVLKIGTNDHEIIVAPEQELMVTVLQVVQNETQCTAKHHNRRVKKTILPTRRSL